MRDKKLTNDELNWMYDLIAERGNELNNVYRDFLRQFKQGNKIPLKQLVETLSATQELIMISNILIKLNLQFEGKGSSIEEIEKVKRNLDNYQQTIDCLVEEGAIELQYIPDLN